MQIEKAYLFARQMTAGGLPPLAENVLYEDGRFNTALMPSGFTNFSDMLVTYNGSIGTYTSRMMSDSYKLLEQYYNTPHIVQFQGTYADSWEYVNGLQRIQTTVPPAGTDEPDIVNYYSSTIMIPIIVGKGDYTKFCVTYELGGTFIGVQFYGKGEEDLIGLYEVNTGALSQAHFGNGSSITVPQTYTMKNDVITYSESRSNFYAWRYVEFFPKLGWSEVKIKKIWFE